MVVAIKFAAGCTSYCFY